MTNEWSEFPPPVARFAPATLYPGCTRHFVLCHSLGGGVRSPLPIINAQTAGPHPSPHQNSCWALPSAPMNGALKAPHPKSPADPFLLRRPPWFLLVFIGHFSRKSFCGVQRGFLEQRFLKFEGVNSARVAFMVLESAVICLYHLPLSTAPRRFWYFPQKSAILPILEIQLFCLLFCLLFSALLSLLT